MMPRRAPVIEVINDDVADMLRRKSGFERWAAVDAMCKAARELIEWSVRTNHPDWESRQVDHEVARRIAGDSD